MNRLEAQQILLLYRPGTSDAEDPLIAEALVLARQDPALARWLEDHCSRQKELRAQFRQIAAPAGLQEQILSEHAARRRTGWRRHPLALALVTLVLITCAGLWLLPRNLHSEEDLAIYRGRMVRAALTGYAMDLETSDMAELRAYLAGRQSPSDYVLPSGLKTATLTGCAIQKWQNANVSLICFRTGKPLRQGETSDLWLFVVDRGTFRNPPASQTPELARVNRLMTATWANGDKVYVLAVAGGEATIRGYL